MILNLIKSSALFVLVTIFPLKDTFATMLPVCQIKVNNVGQLTFTLDNQTNQSWYLLTWQTPFDAWFSEFITIRHQTTAQKVIYQGALAKRAAVTTDDYLTLPAHSHQTIELDLSQVYSLNKGHYDVSLTPLRLLSHDTDLPQPLQADSFIFVDCLSTQMSIVQ